MNRRRAEKREEAGAEEEEEERGEGGEGGGEEGDDGGLVLSWAVGMWKKGKRETVGQAELLYTQRACKRSAGFTISYDRVM